MRAASLLRFVPLALLVHCGSKQDLVIGEILEAAAGRASAPGGNAGEARGGAGGSAPLGTGASSAKGGADASQAGMAGAAEACTPGDTAPLGSLVHRYAFDGSGVVASDSAGNADGAVVGTSLAGDGTVAMDGESRQYIDLPNGIVSSLSDLTVVTWMRWDGGAAYQRIFDFGVTSDGEGLGDAGRSYVAVMPATGFEDQAKPGLGAEIKAPGFPTVTLASAEAMQAREAQVALVLESGVRASLYLNGALLATQPTAITLADIEDVNNWIGQSQYEVNPAYRGAYWEFRIYDAPLTACQLGTLLVRGRESP
jgi:Concanavalin A-like lectin/glucanases superfamily